MGEETALRTQPVTLSESGDKPRAPLLLAVMSALVPGAGHLYAGRRRTGVAILALFLAIVVTAAAAIVWWQDALLRAAVRPTALTAVMVAASVVAVGMVGVVVSAYRLGRPGRLRAGWRLLTGGLVGLLCAAVVAPPALAARYALVQRDLISDIFPSNGGVQAVGIPPGVSTPPGSQGRLNVLLIGGDGDPAGGRMHADSITVASVDPGTGDTVVFSLPRNLRNARFLEGTPAAQDMPNGFPSFVYDVHQFGSEHPWLFPETEDPGAAAVISVASEALGLPIHYYAMGNLDGFGDMVDAIGGLRIEVSGPPPTDGATAVSAADQARPRLLDGRQALSYARPPADTNPYARTMRQRCLVGALGRQADPITVLRNFETLARATKDAVSTNIPQERLPELVDIARKVSNAEITAVLFAPPSFDVANPDFSQMQALVRATLVTGQKPAGQGQPAAIAEQCSYW